MSRFGRDSLDSITRAISRNKYYAISDDRIAQVNARHQVPGDVELSNCSHIDREESSFLFSELTDGILLRSIAEVYR